MTTLTEQIKEEFERITARYAGERFRAEFSAEEEPLGLLPELQSRVYTERVFERGLNISEFRSARLDALRPGVVFRAEILQIPGNQEKYLGALFKTIDGAYSFKAHLETNDLDYVKLHPSFHWKKITSEEK